MSAKTRILAFSLGLLTFPALLVPSEAQQTNTTLPAVLVTASGAQQPNVSAGARYYAKPNGSGSSCSQSSPCSLNTGLSKAGPGDELVLKDGVYAQKVVTVRSGASGKSIVIRAESQHRAIIRPPLPAGSRTKVLDIDHSYITVRGLVLDGSKRYHFMVSIVGSDSNPLNTVTIENNRIENSGGVGFSIQVAQNVIVRHNYINALGYYSSDTCCGSGFYVGSKNVRHPVSNLQIYGNTIRDATNNAVDLKDATAINNADIHHNIIEKHVWPWDHGHTKQAGNGWNDGLIVVYATNTKVHNNIFRDNDSGSSIFKVKGKANNKVLNNVIMNSKTGSVARGQGVLNLAPTEVARNTYCGLSTYKSHPDGTAGLNIHDNKSNAPLSACNAEVARIMNEMKRLPGLGIQPR